MAQTVNVIVAAEDRERLLAIAVEGFFSTIRRGRRGPSSGFFNAGRRIVQPPRHGRFGWICTCNDEGEAIQREFTAFQTAENLIALIVEAASRIGNPVAHS